MKCLIVAAHPLPTSLCKTLTNRVASQLKDAGHEVIIEDLCAASRRDRSPVGFPRENGRIDCLGG